jgi:hypothetical protein
MRTRKKIPWWLIPTLLALMLVGGLLILDSAAVAPFVYTVD